MPRSAKTTTKVKRQVITSSIDLEKGFVTAKSELLNQSGKVLDGLKKQAKQIKSLLKKAQTEKKQAKNKRVSLSNSVKKSNSKTAIKELKKVKQVYEAASKVVEKLQAEQSAIDAQVTHAKTANKKFTSLVKLIEKFNKSWEKKAAKTASGKKRRKVRRIAKLENHIIINPSFDSVS